MTGTISSNNSSNRRRQQQTPPPQKIIGSSGVILVVFLLGLMHAIIVVQSFTSSTFQQSSTKTRASKKNEIKATCRSSNGGTTNKIIRPLSLSTNSNNPLLSDATSWYYNSLSSSSSSSALRSSTIEEAPTVEGLPELGNDGLWHITNEDEYKGLLDANPDKLIILKVFAPWCRACKGLAPKFQALSQDKKYGNLPIVWASLNIQGNKDFVKSIGVLALPTVQLYAGNGLKVDTFPCGPSKVPILKRKLVQLVNEHVDAKTRQLKIVVQEADEVAAAVDAATITTEEEEKKDTTEGEESVEMKATSFVPSTVNATEMYPTATTPKDGEETVQEVIEKEKNSLKGIKYLSDLLESERDELLTKANLLTFEAGSIVMREGNMGRTFYVILDGEVEICQRTSFEDPLTTPPSYLGTVINQLTNKFDFFGERSLITGEPRAVSIRATTQTKCLAFDKSDFPKTSILSGYSSTLIDKTREMKELNEKYGVPSPNDRTEKMYNDTRTVSQTRGSVNTPNKIVGVDDDTDIDYAAAAAEAADGYIVDERGNKVVEDPSELGIGTETIVPLLMRLKLIRSITYCFEYTLKFNLKFGDPGSRRRRNILWQTLSPMQRTYIDDAFRLIDEDKSELINLNEIKRLVNSVGDVNDIGLDSDDKILDIIDDGSASTAASSQHTQQAVATNNSYAPWQKEFTTAMYTKKISKEDFYGLMAESETYQLFSETFQTLDRNDSGFVRAKDLDRILCGVRDLISDDKKSIIDVEDDDMMVDYEQFSRMLVGTPLSTVKNV